MQSPEASTAATPTQIHLALANFADEVVGTLARLFAYVGVLALFAILGLAALGQLPDLRDDEPAERPGWSMADRSHPAFAISRNGRSFSPKYTRAAESRSEAAH